MTYFNNSKISAVIKTAITTAIAGSSFFGFIWLAKNYTEQTFTTAAVIGVLWFLYSTYSYFYTMEQLKKTEKNGKS